MREIMFIFSICYSGIAFGQKMIHSEILPISESEYDYELRISYEGIVGVLLVLRINSGNDTTIHLNEYAYRYSRKSQKNGDYSKDKLFRMEFPVDKKYVSKILELKDNFIPDTDSLDCYKIGLDGNYLRIAYKDKEKIFQENYWETEETNKDCLSKYGINKYYEVLLAIREEISSNKKFLSKLSNGSFGTYGESYLTINNNR